MRLGLSLLACLSLLGCDRAAHRADAPATSPGTVITPASSAPPSPSPAQTNAATLPGDVLAFVERREGCEHFLGEEPYNAEREAFLNKNIKELCTGTDAELAALRRRYAGNPGAMTKLAEFEDTIE